MNTTAHLARRSALLEQIGDGVAIIPTAPERVRNRGSLHPFRFDSYFWYLSGFPEPEAVIVLIGGKAPRTILFCRAKDALREVWEGYRYGPEAAREAFGFDEAYEFSQFDEKLAEFLTNRSTLWHALGYDADWDLRVVAALNTIRRKSRAGKQAPDEIRDLRAPLDRMRLIKDEHERATMRRASLITSAGHARAMQHCRPGMAEYELEAELTYEFRRRGADGHAYSPIVAGGRNACVLHYTENNRPLPDNALVLIDAGCELQGYACDITRTFPVNGKFSGAQRHVYEIVLAAQAAAITAVKPGAPFAAYHDAALRVLVQGLVDLNLLVGSVDDNIASEAYKPYYMHRAGHWLGLDVHDAGEYKAGDDWVTLLPGMTLTVEPGLYIAASASVPEHLHDIGVRIEDDVFVTGDGCEVYTSAPKTIAEIEELMRRE